MTEKDKDEVALQRFVEYIQIKTVQPEPDYDSAMKFLKNYAQELGLEYRAVTLDESRQAALLTWPSTSSTETSIVLNSHIDVVPVFEEHWMVPPFSGEIRDGKIYGRGTQDMKCVGIQYLEAIRRLKAAKYEPKRTIHCLFVPDEEIGGVRGMGKFITLDECKALNIGFVLDEGLASETDVFQVYYGDRSVLWIQFLVKGNTGHGSRLIENTAAEKAQFILNEMLKFRANEKECLEKSEATDKLIQLGNVTTVNLTKLTGGVQQNVVPDQYSLYFDCRIKPDGYDAFKEFLHDVIKRTPKENDDEVILHYVQDSGRVCITDVEKPSWWLNCFKRTCEQMKCKTNWTVFPAATDGRYLRGEGYPAIGFSPMINTPILLHDHNEYLHKDVFLHGIEIYVKLLENLTNGESAYVIQLPSGSFKSPAEAAESYLEKLEKGGAKKTRPFQVDLVSYSPSITNSKTVHVLSHSEYPASSFAFAEQSNSQMLVADNTFIALMNKLKTLRAFETRLPKMEARGTRLEYQDFVINLGTVSQSQTTKGLVLEVAYVPMDETRDGYCLIQEFLQSFLNMPKQMIQKLITEQLSHWIRSLKDKKDAEYTPSITLLQYMDILIHMRKQPNE
ncbi:unnamed protein product [Adineta steineri]|uniref:Peptidase M20 dimerisation domain-containing protein n=4 Tax=Adineta steineri TaxID=433720 RepID=A0A813PE77_9BILA|nr:unnamed protein product [Adineta steineri]